MKTKKSRVVLSSVSVLLVLSLLAGMTMAWFTDTEKVNANFTAGVLDISVKPGETDKGDLTFENLRPMLYDNFYKELEPNGNEKWVNDVTQDNTTGLDDEDYAPVPAYFKPVVIKNEGTLPAKVKLSLEAGDGCEAGEPILTEDNITIKQDPEKMQDCANRLAPVLKVFVYKLVGETWTKVEDVNLNTAYDEAKANPDKVASDNTAKETNNTYMTAMLPAQGTATYVIAGYLPETVNNAYQGQHFHGKLVLNAYQMDDTEAGVPDEGGSSEKPDPGEPDNPDCNRDDHMIRTAEDMNNIRLHPHCNFVLANDIDLSEAYPSWEPIGELEEKYSSSRGTYYEPTENVFTGDLDGNGFRVTGLHVEPGTLKGCLGLFSYSSGTIRNLTVEGAAVVACNDSGILVGRNAGTILNCTVNGKVSDGDPTKTIKEVGGITGWNEKTGTISRCASFAEVSGTSQGRIVHKNYGGIAGKNSGTVANCYTTGLIRGAESGGLLGTNEGNISDCYTISTVYASNNSFGNVDTNTHPTIGDSGGTIEKDSIFYQKGNMYRMDRPYDSWHTITTKRGQAKSEEEMKTASTYTDAGWDTGVWNIVDGTYPTLQ